MQIENNKEQVPFEHYQALFRQADAAGMAERSGAKWDGEKFYVNLLGTEYQISHPEYAIACNVGEAFRLPRDGKPVLAMTEEGTIPSGSGKCRQDQRLARNVSGHCPLPLPVQTFLLRYLLEGKQVLWQGQWKTFREMPWGELYIKPYTGRVLTRAAFTFGTRVEAFKNACEKMGATKLSHGDAGYEFDFLGGYKMRIMVWAGDEEFPPNAQILYSDNFETGFAPEDRVVAGDILIGAIKSRM
ncbi:MAG: DUF3786 domain-containing protein [Oscillospiraceae bacterium]|nr:DUF3786 domain-containing protein [Oscillospiraceae bacterium]